MAAFKNQLGDRCSANGCEHFAPSKGELCRYHKGLKADKALVASRKAQGLPLRPPLNFELELGKPEVKKSKVKIQAVKRVPLDKLRTGMQLAPDHGTVISMSPHTGRSLWTKGKKLFKHSHKQPKGYILRAEGKDGVLVTTDKRKVWFPLGSEVWVNV